MRKEIKSSRAGPRTFVLRRRGRLFSFLNQRAKHSLHTFEYAEAHRKLFLFAVKLRNDYFCTSARGDGGMEPFFLWLCSLFVLILTTVSFWSPFTSKRDSLETQSPFGLLLPRKETAWRLSLLLVSFCLEKRQLGDWVVR